MRGSLPNRMPLMSAVYAYCGSVLLLLVVRRQLPDIPWIFLPFLVFVSLPVATAVTCVLGRTHAENVVTKVAGAVSGLALVWWSGPHVLWPIGALASALWQWRGQTRPIFMRILSAIVILTLGYATVWNLNTILAPLSVGRLRDPLLVSVDLWLLGTNDYRSVFPIVDHALGFALLERAYLFLFAQIICVVVWQSWIRPARNPGWLAVLFGAYAIGLLVFLVWPAVGPHIYIPESLGAEWHQTPTFEAMHRMATDYQNVVAGGRGGINYFIAFPSLHVAAAAICQWGLRGAGFLFWAMLPITVLVSASTFLLGYHYAVDIPAGLATAALSWHLFGRGVHVPEDTALPTIA
jgi:hypothetical protein